MNVQIFSSHINDLLDERLILRVGIGLPGF